MSLCILLGAASGATAQHQAGFTRLVAADSVTRDSIPVAIWYPTSRPERDVEFGPYHLRIAPDGPIAPSGRIPLVLISHGGGGSELGHWDTAAEPARAGFVVAAVRHPGDNFRDGSALGTDRQVFGRSHHVTATLRTVLTHSQWRTNLDSTKVGSGSPPVGTLA